ncbi:MAG: ABC transporter ATP-binding protein [Actinobacteria bacterium]|nr:ABC transporter ATP-binding protein [Actinomycetota bacterium]
MHVRNGDPVVNVEGLRKAYGHLAAVDGISFSVRRGEIFGLLGPNGAGKTTAVECIEGLRPFDAGSVDVVGLDPRTQADELRLHIGCQLQQSALPDNIRVWEALDMFASLYGSPVDWRRLMDQWGLAEKRSARFHSLSGGQKQRLFVALALVNDPEVVFLDEMTTGLDPAARRVAWTLVDELREQGTTVVLVTHFMDEAERLCDRVAVIEGGRIMAIDTPTGLVAASGGGIRAVFGCDPAADLGFLTAIPGVAEVRRAGRRVEVAGDGPHVALVAAALVAHDLPPADFRVQQPSLEDAFLRLTGHGMGG